MHFARGQPRGQPYALYLTTHLLEISSQILYDAIFSDNLVLFVRMPLLSVSGRGFRENFRSGYVVKGV